MPLTITDPAFFYATISQILMYASQPMYIFDQFVEKELDLRKGQGDTVDLKRYPYIGEAGLTEALRKANESNTIGIGNPVNITAQSVSMVLGEFIGPYSTAGSALAPLGVTEKVAKYASQKLLDYENPTEFMNSIGANLLKDDHDRAHDRFLANRFLASTNFTNPASKADAATVVTDKWTSADTLTVKEKLQSRFAQPFDDGYYRAIVNSRGEKHLMQDADFKAAVQFGDPERLYRGEIGNYLGFKWLRSENMPTRTVNALTAQQLIFCGKGSVGYAEGEKPEIRLNKNDDYGRFLYLIWRAVRAYATLNTDFIELGRTFAV